jgi:hypothetical protein
MRFATACQLLAIALLAGACDSHDTTLPIDHQTTTIHLTQAQAATLVSRVTTLAPVHPELAWLADSVSLVLKAGAEANRIEITTDLASGPFYAVGLQRAITTSTNSSATFDLIAFNDPTSPTDFIIVDGYRSTVATQPPQSASGNFGVSSNGTISGHLFHVAGSTVSAWRADAGTASVATGTTGAACAGFPLTGGVTCTQAALQASFTITGAHHDNGAQPTDVRSASLSPVSVAGIQLRFLFP